MSLASASVRRRRSHPSQATKRARRLPLQRQWFHETQDRKRKAAEASGVEGLKDAGRMSWATLRACGVFPCSEEVNVCEEAILCEEANVSNTATRQDGVEPAARTTASAVSQSIDAIREANRALLQKELERLGIMSDVVALRESCDARGAASSAPHSGATELYVAQPRRVHVEPTPATRLRALPSRAPQFTEDDVRKDPKSCVGVRIGMSGYYQTQVGAQLQRAMFFGRIMEAKHVASVSRCAVTIKFDVIYHKESDDWRWWPHNLGSGFETYDLRDRRVPEWWVANEQMPGGNSQVVLGKTLKVGAPCPNNCGADLLLGATEACPRCGTFQRSEERGGGIDWDASEGLAVTRRTRTSLAELQKRQQPLEKLDRMLERARQERRSARFAEWLRCYQTRKKQGLSPPSSPRLSCEDEDDRDTDSRKSDCEYVFAACSESEDDDGTVAPTQQVRLR